MLKPKSRKQTAGNKEPMKGQRVNSRVRSEDRRAPFRKLPLVLYRLAMPGGILLLITGLLVHMGYLAGAETPFVRFYTDVVFGIGLLLRAFFKRSRLFFAMLVIVLAERTLTWFGAGFLSVKESKTAFEAIALLLPINLLALAFVRDRGIISRVGKQRIAVVALQIVTVVIFCKPAQAYAATVFDYAPVPKHFLEWSNIPQPALLAFIVAGVGMIILLFRPYVLVGRNVFLSQARAAVALQTRVGKQLVALYFSIVRTLLTLRR